MVPIFSDIQEIRRANTLQIIKEKFDGKKSRFAEALGMQGGYVTRMLKPDSASPRSIGDPMARRIEKLGGKPQNWLDTPHEETEPIGSDGSRTEVDNAVLATTRGRVPVVSWVVAGSWAEIDDHFLPNEDYEWIDTTDLVTEKEAIALEVDGKSMYTADDPNSFPPGCIIIVKRADLREPRSGDFVVVRLENEKRATFKQLVIDGDRKYLHALNPAFPTIEVTSPATFVGVVTEKIIRTRY